MVRKCERTCGALSPTSWRRWRRSSNANAEQALQQRVVDLAPPNRARSASRSILARTRRRCSRHTAAMGSRRRPARRRRGTTGSDKNIWRDREGPAGGPGRPGPVGARGHHLEGVAAGGEVRAHRFAADPGVDPVAIEAVEPIAEPDRRRPRSAPARRNCTATRLVPAASVAGVGAGSPSTRIVSMRASTARGGVSLVRVDEREPATGHHPQPAAVVDDRAAVAVPSRAAGEAVRLGEEGDRHRPARRPNRRCPANRSARREPGPDGCKYRCDRGDPRPGR